LGEFIDHLTYGPILPGQTPQPVADGVAIIGQKAVRPTGVRLDRAIQVAEGSAYDLPRCRLRRRDIVLCRSGVGSLGRRRFTVFDEAVPATVSCFVDLIRLRELNPYYVVIFLRSPRGWAQIERLINGVGTPNLSFGEIRSLRIPVPPADEQRAIEERWAPVRAAHRAGHFAAAEEALDETVMRLN
jgi:type I restriction enzyme S subunit